MSFSGAAPIAWAVSSSSPPSATSGTKHFHWWTGERQDYQRAMDEAAPWWRSRRSRFGETSGGDIDLDIDDIDEGRDMDGNWEGVIVCKYVISTNNISLMLSTD